MQLYLTLLKARGRVLLVTAVKTVPTLILKYFCLVYDSAGKADLTKVTGIQKENWG